MLEKELRTSDKHRAYVASSRVAQGLPVTIGDPVALAAIAKLLRAPDKTNTVSVEVRSSANPRRAHDHTVKKSA